MGHDKENLGKNDQDNNDEGEGKENKRDLDIETQEAAPRSGAESRPSIADRDVSLAVNDSGLNLTLERAVEADNGLVLLRKKRGLDTDEDHVGGNRDEDGHGDGDGEDDERLPAGTLVVGVLGRLAGLDDGHLEVEELGHHVGGKRSSMVGGSREEDSSPGSAESAAELRQAAPEVQARGLRDDDVNPGGAELDKSERGQDAADDGADVTEGSAEDGQGNERQEGDAHEAGQAADVGTETAVEAQETVDAAHGGGDDVVGNNDGIWRLGSGRHGEDDALDGGIVVFR